MQEPKHQEVEGIRQAVKSKFTFTIKTKSGDMKVFVVANSLEHAKFKLGLPDCEITNVEVE